MPKAATVRHPRGLRGNRPLQWMIAGYALLWIALAIFAVGIVVSALRTKPPQ